MSDKLSDDERARLDAEVKRDYQMGAAWPFDAPDTWWSGRKRAELAAVDSAHAAARAVIRDLSDRGGIKRGFENIDEETRVEIVTKLAAIIRAASPAPAIPAESIEKNTPIDELVTSYQQDGFDFEDAARVKAVALRYAESMPDSHARALLHVLASAPAISESEDAPWVRVEDRMPEAQRTVIATYLNQYGKRRRIRAQYIPANTRESNGDDGDLECLYDEATDTFYWPAGWYECIDNWGDYTHVFVGDGQVTHWTDMPEAPVDAARDGCGS